MIQERLSNLSVIPIKADILDKFDINGIEKYTLQLKQKKK